MKSIKRQSFRSHFEKLPAEIKVLARKNYLLWKKNPSHRSLRFKRLNTVNPYYSIRIGIGWRALALVENNVALWFWIGSHADYDLLIERL